MTALAFDVRRSEAMVRSDDGRVVAHLHDMGGSCGVYTEGALAPDEATKLGHALIAWSAWRRRVIPTIDHFQRTSGS